MGKFTMVSSILVKGDITKVYEVIQNSLKKMDYTVTSSNPPSKLNMKRGKGGLLTTQITNAKTVLKISLKESSNNGSISILFDYEFELRGMFTGKDKDHIQGELILINHELFDISASIEPKFLRDFKQRKK